MKAYVIQNVGGPLEPIIHADSWPEAEAVAMATWPGIVIIDVREVKDAKGDDHLQWAA